MPATTRPDEIDFLGARARILASGESFGLVDMVEVPAGQMPPLHVHRHEDEGFYVMAGDVTMFMPGRQVTLTAGDFFLAPRDVPHSYRVGDAPARWLVTSIPGGFERFVAGVAALDQPDPEGLNAVAAQHDIEILGPPGAMP